jgi:hypothetical protein
MSDRSSHLLLNVQVRFVLPVRQRLAGSSNARSAYSEQIITPDGPGVQPLGGQIVIMVSTRPDTKKKAAEDRRLEVV